MALAPRTTETYRVTAQLAELTRTAVRFHEKMITALSWVTNLTSIE
jgi:hypothetical protein